MLWAEIRAAYPEQWLVVEALSARTVGQRRVFDEIDVVDVCADGATTMRRCWELQRVHPTREFCFVHTAMVELEIVEHRWAGIRASDAPHASL